MTSAETPDPLLTVKGLAELEGIPEQTLRKCISRKGMPHVRMGGIRIRLSEYKAWLEEQRYGNHPNAKPTKSSIEEAIDVARDAAAGLRAQGIISLSVPGLKMELIPQQAAKVTVDSNDHQTPDDQPASPMQDAVLYGRADGTVPGFAKLQKNSDQE